MNIYSIIGMVDIYQCVLNSIDDDIHIALLSVKIIIDIMPL